MEENTLQNNELDQDIEKIDSLPIQEEITDAKYDEEKQELTISSKNISKLNEYKEKYKTKDLVIEIDSESGKQDILDNINIIRTHRDGTVFLSDISEGQSLEDIQKYEKYANGNIVLFKSEIIKETMGFDRLPAGKSNGISYNLRIDGSKLKEKDMYTIEGDKLAVFLNDLKEIAEHCPLGGINIKNIKMPGGQTFEELSQVFSIVNRITVENSDIPGLKDLINGIEDKSKIETIKIKECGMYLEDIDAVGFQNIYSLEVEQTKPVEVTEKPKVEEEYKTPKIEVKVAWYKTMWNKVKKLPLLNRLFIDKKIKALPKG